MLHYCDLSSENRIHKPGRKMVAIPKEIVIICTAALYPDIVCPFVLFMFCPLRCSRENSHSALGEIGLFNGLC